MCNKNILDIDSFLFLGVFINDAFIIRPFSQAMLENKHYKMITIFFNNM